MKDFVFEPSMVCRLYDDKIVDEGVIVISGVVDGNDDINSTINGEYVLSPESLNGMPVYEKRNDTELKLEMFQADSGSWRWQIKRQDMSDDEAFGYGIAGDVVFPFECEPKDWYYRANTEFTKMRSGISISLIDESSVPDYLYEMKDLRQREWITESSTKIDEVVIDTYMHT